MVHAFRRVRSSRSAMLALLILILLVQLPSSAAAVEGSDEPPSSTEPSPSEEPSLSDMPQAIRELCEAMMFSDFARWYQLLSDESRQARTEEEFIIQHERLVESTIAGLERQFNAPFMVRTEVTVLKYPKFYIGTFRVIYFSPESFEQGRVVYESVAEIAFELEPDGRVTTKFGAYGDTGWKTKLTIQPPRSL